MKQETSLTIFVKSKPLKKKTGGKKTKQKRGKKKKKLFRVIEFIENQWLKPSFLRVSKYIPTLTGFNTG